MKRRIGILTSGGDCPGLNATIRGVAKACYEMLGTENVEIVGISDGYYGLIHNICKEMSPDDFSGILTRRYDSGYQTSAVQDDESHRR